MIVTGEASGDLHGANLVRAMLKRNPLLSFTGMGGSEMATAGVNLLCDAGKVSVVGVAEVVSRLPDIFKAQHILKKQLACSQPDLLIIIDLPDFNLMLAKKAKQLGVPVFYYICPQVWAWRSGRTKTILKRVDTAGVILPFEEKFLRDRGVEASYVGHPLLDTVEISENRDVFLKRLSISHDSVCIGLLPGSREREISTLLPIFLEAAKLLQEKIDKKITFLIPLASTITETELNKHGVEEYSQYLDIHVVSENRYNMMAACNTVVAASGTVTLELALLNTPMVVTYRLSPLSYFLGNLLVKLKHFSLVNLIAEREIVPELLQDEVTPEKIALLLHELSFDQEKRSQLLDGLGTVRKVLGGKGASDKAASLALEMISNN